MTRAEIIQRLAARPRTFAARLLLWSAAGRRPYGHARLCTRRRMVRAIATDAELGGFDLPAPLRDEIE